MSVIKDIIAEATFTSALSRMTKAAKKAGVDRDECQAIFSAVLSRHYATPAPDARVVPGPNGPKP